MNSSVEVNTEAKYSISFTEDEKKMLKSTLQQKQQLFVNGIKIYQFKAKDFELFPYPHCLGNILKTFPAANMKETELNRYIFDFSVGWFDISVNNILDIHEN